MRKRKQGVIATDFEQTARQMFPHRSLFQVTKEVNKILEGILFDSKKKR